MDPHEAVIPAKAGIPQHIGPRPIEPLDSCLRRNDSDWECVAQSRILRPEGVAISLLCGCGNQGIAASLALLAMFPIVYGLSDS